MAKRKPHAKFTEDGHLGEREHRPAAPVSSWRDGDARGTAHVKKLGPAKSIEERRAEERLAILGPATRVELSISLPGHRRLHYGPNRRIHERYTARITTGVSRETVKALLCDAVDRAFESEAVYPWVGKSA